MKNNDLEQLFLRFRDDGDMRALARLFDVAAPQLLPVAVHLSPRRDEADDLIQATFLSAIERADSYERERPVLPWLLGILALHAHKQRHRQGRALDLERVHRPVDSGPEEFAASAEVREAVGVACRGLPDVYAKIVERHLVDGLEPIELASQFGLTNGAARVRLHRGLKLLRRALPAAYASGAYAATSTRGLGSIRAAVLQRASLLTGSPIPAAGFAPLGLLLTFLLPILAVLPAWLIFRPSSSSASVSTPVVEVAASSATTETAAVAENVLVETDLRSESELEIETEPAPPLLPRASSDAVVRGRLLLADGTPAAGATVKIVGRAPSEELAHPPGVPENWHDPELQTGADGRFEFTFAPPPGFLFEMEADHASAAKASWTWYQIATGSTKELGDIALEATATVIVHLVDADSNPLSTGWNVTLEAPTPTAAQGRRDTRMSVKSVAGSVDFVLQRVPARRTAIEARSDHGGHVEPVLVELVAGETKQAELRYTGPNLGRRITVTTSTAPFHWMDMGAYAIHATRSGSAPIAAAYSTTGMMEYLIDGCEPGDYEVAITDPHFKPWSKSGVHPGEIVSAKLVGNAALQLHLTDGQGAPYTGPYTLQGKFFSSSASGVSSSTSFVLVDPTKGLPPNQRIDGMIPSDYALTLEAPGSAPQSISVVGLAVNEVREISCTVSAGISLSGRVVGSDGTTPVAADVQLTRGPRAGHTGPAGSMLMDRQGPVPRLDQRMATDAQGSFTFSGLSAGPWTVRAGGKYLSVDRTLDVSANSEPLVLRLPPSGSLSGQLLVPPGVSLSDSELWIWLEDESAPSGLTVKHDELQPDGSFHYGPLPLGEARLSLMTMNSNGGSGSGGNSGTIFAAMIEDGVETHAEIDLRDGFPGRLKVHVVIDGASASGGGFEWSPMDTPLTANGYRGAIVTLDGNSRLGAIKPGNVRIRYESKDKTWGWQVPQPIAITAGQEVIYELVLHTTARDLRCLDAANGAVLADVEVEWRSALGDEPVTAKARTDAQGLLHLRMPDQQVEVRCVGATGPFATIAWGAGTGPVSVSVQRAP